MRCLFRRFKGYPHCVTKVLQTLLRYLDTREGLRNQQIGVAICGAGVPLAVLRGVPPAECEKWQKSRGLRGGNDAYYEGGMPALPNRACENLVLRQLFHGLEQVCGLRQDGIFQVRVVGDEDVHGGNPPNRGIKMLEELVGDSGGDFRAISPA
jgi:hypothetical protein